MRLTLQIETHDRRPGFDIAGKDNSLSSGILIDAPGGVKIVYQA